MRFPIRLISTFSVGLLVCGCQKAPPPRGSVRVATSPAMPAELKPGETPSPPLALQPPPAEPADLGGQDLREVDPARLRQLAHRSASERDFAAAVRYQYWACQQADGGRYDLACYYARAGRTDPAFYWLQSAALEEGVDAGWAGDDDDLAVLRRDPRWPAVRQYLDLCGQYWARHGKPATTLVLPDEYDPAADPPIWAVAWLHGLGSNPENFVDPDDEEGLCQQLADTLNVAFIGVSGTIPRGKTKFVWAEDPARDLERVKAAVVEVAGDVKVRPAGLIAFGFSQGAQVGLELAVRQPDLFAGAIVLSPGTSGPVRLREVTTPSRLLRQRGFVFGCGASEHPGNRQQTVEGARWVRTNEGKVMVKAFPGQKEHTFPTDFAERFPEWVRFIQSAQAAANRPAR
jgi:predicted esterase